MKTYTLTEDRESNKKVMEQIEKDCESFIYFAQDNGYDVYYPFLEDGCLKLELAVNDSVEYLPKIYINKFLGQDEFGVKIQTTSYGALDQKEFTKFLKAQQNAMSVATAIEKLYKSEYFPIVICN